MLGAIASTGVVSGCMEGITPIPEVNRRTMSSIRSSVRADSHEYISARVRVTGVPESVRESTCSGWTCFVETQIEQQAFIPVRIDVSIEDDKIKDILRSRPESAFVHVSMVPRLRVTIQEDGSRRTETKPFRFGDSNLAEGAFAVIFRLTPANSYRGSYERTLRVPIVRRTASGRVTKIIDAQDADALLSRAQFGERNRIRGGRYANW